MVNHMVDAQRRDLLVAPIRAARGGGRIPTVWPVTAIVVGDTHIGSENNDIGDPNVRQIDAINTIESRVFPLGGVCGRPSWVLQIGDLKHEATETVDRAASYYAPGGGLCVFPAHIMDGNHDQNDVRDLIIARHGSLTWGKSLGGVYFQAMTENYIAENDTHPPDLAQIAMVQSMLLARPASETKIICVHRALSGGYPAEWQPPSAPEDSLTAFLVMITSVPNVKFVIFGHDHYQQNIVLSGGIPGISPGSVRMFPQDCPYSTVYPEAFLVLRIWPRRIEYGCYQFGFSQTPDTPCPPGRVYAPNTWLFSGSVAR